MKPSILGMIEDSLGADEQVHSVTVTGQDGDTLYVLVVRQGEHNGDVMLKERYMAVDLQKGEAVWTGQGINRRVTGEFGEFARAMVRSYARVQQAAKGGEVPDLPLILDARGESYAAAKTRITGPYDRKPEKSESPIVDRRHEAAEAAKEPAQPDDGKAKTAGKSVEPKGGVQPSFVTCRVTGEKVRRVDAVNVGAALGQDFWVAKEHAPDGAKGGDK